MTDRRDKLVQKHALRADLIYKIRDGRRPVSPANPGPTLDPETQKRWELWANALISRTLDARCNELEELLVFIIVTLRREFRAELDLVIKETESEETATRLLELRQQLHDRLQQEAENGGE
jgi:hypothetical protein